MSSQHSPDSVPRFREGTPGSERDEKVREGKGRKGEKRRRQMGKERGDGNGTSFHTGTLFSPTSSSYINVHLKAGE